MNVPLRIFNASTATRDRYACLVRMTHEIPGITGVKIVRGNPTVFLLQFGGSGDTLALQRKEVEGILAGLRLGHALSTGLPVDIKKYAGHEFDQRA